MAAPQITTEQLLAFLDGEIQDPQEQQQIRSALAQSPELQKRFDLLLDASLELRLSNPRMYSKIEAAMVDQRQGEPLMKETDMTQDLHAAQPETVIDPVPPPIDADTAPNRQTVRSGTELKVSHDNPFSVRNWSKRWKRIVGATITTGAAAGFLAIVLAPSPAPRLFASGDQGKFVLLRDAAKELKPKLPDSKLAIHELQGPVEIEPPLSAVPLTPPDDPKLREIWDYLISIADPIDITRDIPDTVETAEAEYLSNRYLLPSVWKMRQIRSYDELLTNMHTLVPGLIIQYKPLQQSGDIVVIDYAGTQEAQTAADKNAPAVARSPKCTIHLIGPVRKDGDQKRKPIPMSMSYDPSRTIMENGKTREVTFVEQVRQFIESSQAMAGREFEAPPAPLFFTSEEAHSNQQMNLLLGAHAEGGTGFSASFNLNRDDLREVNRAAVFVCFQQRFFTAQMEQPKDLREIFRPGQTLENLKLSGKLGPDNPPCYVSDVSFGRLVVLAVRSEHSSRKLKTAMQAHFSSVFGSGGASLTDEQKEILGNSNYTLWVYGGASDKVSELIPVNGVNGFDCLSKVQGYIRAGEQWSPKNPGLPIAYRVRYLKNNQTAKIVGAADLALRRSAKYAARVRVSRIEINEDHDSQLFRGDGDFCLFLRKDDEPHNIVGLQFGSGDGGRFTDLAVANIGLEKHTFKLAMRFGEEDGDGNDDVNWDRASHWDGQIFKEWSIDLRDCKDGPIELVSEGGGNKVVLTVDQVVNVSADE